MLYIVDIHGEIEGDFEIIGKYESINMVIEALKAESCDKAVSYGAMLNTLDAYEASELDNHVPSVLRKALEDLPSVTPKQKTGKWITGQTIGDGFTCSECNTHYHMYPMFYQFCPNCGAKMEGESK